MKVLFIYSFFKTKQNKNMHCLQCLPPAVAESSYTPSQFIMGVAIFKVMPRPLCPSPKKLLCICKSMSSLPASKKIISSLNTLQQSLFYVTFIEFIRWFHQFSFKLRIYEIVKKMSLFIYSYVLLM